MTFWNFIRRGEYLQSSAKFPVKWRFCLAFVVATAVHRRRHIQFLGSEENKNETSLFAEIVYYLSKQALVKNCYL
jgi:hypothetical protein